MHHRTMVLLVAAVLSGCERGAGAAPTFVVRDSSGIQIVESNAPVWGTGDAWTLSTQPVISIGEIDGAPEYQLSQVRDARRLSTGAIAVANAGSGEIRIFSPDGSLVRAVGGLGGGPGEFRGMEWIQVLPDDSVAAYDARERRLTVFAPDGLLARTAPVQADPSGGVPRPLAIFADGGVLSMTTRFPEGLPPTGLTRVPSSVSRISADGKSLNPIAELAGDERIINVQSGTGGVTSISVQTHPFYRRSHVQAAGGRVFVADTDHFQVRVHAADGGLERIIRRPGDPVPIGDADIEAYRTALVERAESPDQRRIAGASVADMIFPESRPAFSSFRIDERGWLWVEPFRFNDDAASDWSVFDEDGRWLGDVEMPARFRPTEIGDAYVLGVWRDALDVEHVRVHDLSKP